MLAHAARPTCLPLIATLLLACARPVATPDAPAAPVPASAPAPTADEHADLVRVAIPSAGQLVTSPLRVGGEARGAWFFEASFPVMLLDQNGKVLVSHYAQAQGEWMTPDFVRFTADLTFPTPETELGALVLKKANASGLPEHDDELRIAVRFAR